MSRKRACDVCYRRKIQCSSPDESSSCEWCSEHKLPCTYTRQKQKQKRNRVKLSDVQELFRRIEQLESTVADSRSNGSASVQSQPTASAETTPGGILDESSAAQVPQIPDLSLSNGLDGTQLLLGQNPNHEYHLGQNWYCMGSPLFSAQGEQWVQSKTGQDFSFGKLKLFNCSADFLPSPASTAPSNEKSRDIPGKEMVQELANIFFKSSFHLAFPVLDEILFTTAIEPACQHVHTTSSHLKMIANAFVMAALSLMSCVQETTHLISQADGVMYAAQAQQLLGCVTERASTMGLQTVLILQRFHEASGRRENMNILHAVACRMVCVLGGHINFPRQANRPSASKREGYLLRRLFWLCYASDKDISLHSGHYPLLTEENCDLTALEKYHDDEDTAHAALLAFSPHHLHLCALKEKVYRELFSYRATKLTDTAFLLRIRQMDDEAEAWRLSIPLEFRPNLSISPRETASSAPVNGADYSLCIYLQLEYHYMMATIHTAVRRCGADSITDGNIPDDLHSTIHSSCDISLEASRSTLNFMAANPAAVLERSETTRVGFYATVAALSLFTDVLSHPRSPQSGVGIQHIDSAIVVFRSLLGSQPTEDGSQKQMSETVEFLEKLARLSRCAVAKAVAEDERSDWPDLRNTQSCESLSPVLLKSAGPSEVEVTFHTRDCAA